MDVNRLAQQLIRDEGLRTKAYRDSRGFLTIGVGHNLDAKPISEPAAMHILQDDVGDVLADLKAHLPWVFDLDDTRAGAVANMTFNLGVEKLLQFHKFLGHLQAGEWLAAADEMRSSAWHTEVGPRALRLEKQVETGTWQ